MICRLFFAVAVSACTAGLAHASIEVHYDFADNGHGNALVNGQSVDGVSFADFKLTTGGTKHAGAAIFDSTEDGPNELGKDPDLLVNLGNLLILQNNAQKYLKQTKPGIFDIPDDDANHKKGSFVFEFFSPVELISIDLVDIDKHVHALVKLTDDQGLTRKYTVPKAWTNDIDKDGPQGFATLDLISITPQDGENPGKSTKAKEETGFNRLSVERLEVILKGRSPSGAIDNLRFFLPVAGQEAPAVPEPGAWLLWAGLAWTGSTSLARRRAC